MTAVVAERQVIPVDTPERAAAEALASGAADAGELRRWLQMAGLIPYESGRAAPVIPAEKLCRKCGKVKQASEWNRNASRPDSLAAQCKACSRAYPRFRDTEEGRRAQRARYARSREGKPDMRLKENRGTLADSSQMRQVTVLLPSGLLALLAAEAAETGAPIAGIIRAAVAARYAPADSPGGAR